MIRAPGASAREGLAGRGHNIGRTCSAKPISPLRLRLLQFTTCRCTMMVCVLCHSRSRSAHAASWHWASKPCCIFAGKVLVLLTRCPVNGALGQNAQTPHSQCRCRSTAKASACSACRLPRVDVVLRSLPMRLPLNEAVASCAVPIFEIMCAFPWRQAPMSLRPLPIRIK